VTDVPASARACEAGLAVDHDHADRAGGLGVRGLLGEGQRAAVDERDRARGRDGGEVGCVAEPGEDQRRRVRREGVRGARSGLGCRARRIGRRDRVARCG
jgi:hypothetical protein